MRRGISLAEIQKDLRLIKLRQKCQISKQNNKGDGAETVSFKPVTVNFLHLNGSRINSLKTSVINYLKQSNISQGQEKFTMKEIPDPKKNACHSCCGKWYQPTQHNGASWCCCRKGRLALTGSCF